MIQPTLLLFLTGGLAYAQTFQFGVKGAVPLLDTSAYGTDESRPYNVGPSVEVPLPKGFALEGDALYQRIGQSNGFNIATIIPEGARGPFTGIVFSRMRGNSWQFPILAKRYFRVRSSPWQPFVSLGPSVRWLNYQYSTSETILGQDGPVNYQGLSRFNNWSVGATAAAGTRLQKGRLAILPELRLTRWAQNNGNALSRNQANAFLGLSF